MAGPASNLQYNPAADYRAYQANFTFKANDGPVDSNVTTVSITVNSVNDNPDAVDDTISTREDTQVTIGEKDNDRDVDGDTLFIESIPTFPVPWLTSYDESKWKSHL